MVVVTVGFVGGEAIGLIDTGEGRKK